MEQCSIRLLLTGLVFNLLGQRSCPRARYNAVLQRLHVVLLLTFFFVGLCCVFNVMLFVKVPPDNRVVEQCSIRLLLTGLDARAMQCGCYRAVNSVRMNGTH